jgi:hypothetical protein
MAPSSERVVADDSASDAVLMHAWRYFELHANQRMSVFNFFLALSGVVSAGLAALVQEDPHSSFLGVLLGLLLILVSFVFWKLDQRVSFLIKHAESALSELEGALPNKQARLFLCEPSKTDAVTSGHWWSRHWTYGQSFRMVFFVMALIGIGGSVLSTFRFAEILRW